MDRIIVIDSCRDCDRRKVLTCTTSHKRIPNINEIPKFCPLKPVWEFYEELKEKNNSVNC